jgi:hypothetical protein
VHDIVVEEIGEEDLLAESEQAVLEVECGLFGQALVGVNQSLPLLLRQVGVVARNSQILPAKDVRNLFRERTAIHLSLSSNALIVDVHLLLALPRQTAD